MTVKGEIAEYRERLDKTLASNDLTDEETLRALVKEHILKSTEHDSQESTEYVINKRTSELSNFLGMLRSTSECNDGMPQRTSHPTWKVKQDTDDIRVMYREGPEGSPYHILLAEGYVDAPIDACLCVSVEVALYPTWFPETKVPTFKIILAQCLKRLRIGENISLVRMKLSWPLSNREALIHFFEFEYLQEGLVIVLTHTPDIENIQKEIHDFSDDDVPESGQTVRVGVVGGFALQKVTDGRCYFRTIASLDVKLDFVPPWLINFMSRQLIGTGFKLYKKILTSKSKDDENIAKALNDPLYIRIRKALNTNAELKRTASMKIDQGDTLSVPEEQINHVESDDKEVSEVEHGSDSSESSPEYTASSDRKPSNEIEEEEVQESKNPEEYLLSTEKGSTKTNYSPRDDHTTENHFDHKNVRLSPQVQRALGTLDKAISIVREARTRSQIVSPVHFSPQGSPKLEISEAKLMAMEDYDGMHSNTASAPLTPPNAERMDRTQQKHSSRSSIPSIRLNPRTTGSPNGLAPTSPELILSSSNASPQATPSISVQNGFMETPNSNISDNGKHEDKTNEPKKKSRQHKKWRICCLHLVSGRLVS